MSKLSTAARTFKALRRGLITKYFEEIFRKNKNLSEAEAALSSFDIEKLLLGVAAKQFRRFKLDGLDEIDKDAMVTDALMGSCNKDTLAKWDSTKGPLPSYLSKMFQMRLQTELVSYLDHAKYRQDVGDGGGPEGDLTQEDMLDHLHDHEVNPVFNDNYHQQLIDRLGKYIAKKARTPLTFKVFYYAIQGFSNTEIAKEAEVSPAAVSQQLKNIVTLIQEFAKMEGNDSLMFALQQYTQTKRHASGDIFNVLKGIIMTAAADDEVEQSRDPIGDLVEIAILKK